LGGSSGAKGGKQAKGRDKDVPAFSEVCEACKLYLDADMEIPLPLMARLIKFRLLIIKDADIKNQRASNVWNNNRNDKQIVSRAHDKKSSDVLLVAGQKE